MRGLDPTNPAGDAGGCSRAACSTSQKSPAQEAALAAARDHARAGRGLGRRGRRPGHRRADAERRPSCRRPYAAAAPPAVPAEQTFASLVGLELRPRRLRDASTLWGSLRTRQGTEARDGVWMHPDLLPTAADLDDPLGFREDAAAPPSAQRRGLRRRAARSCSTAPTATVRRE